MLVSSLVAGVVSGAAGLLVFLIIHHFWIQPIWFILPPGLIIASLGGLAVGWAYAELKDGLPARPWTALAVFCIVAATLTPSILLAQLRPAPLDIATGAIIHGTAASLVARFVLELMLTATLVGGLIGWWLGHSSRAAAATALAGLIFALGPGHNIPLLGSTPAVGKGVILLAAIIIVSAVVLVEAHAVLARVK